MILVYHIHNNDNGSPRIVLHQVNQGGGGGTFDRADIVRP